MGSGEFSTWELLNSPFVLTILGFVLGGIIASALSAHWQRRSQRHAVRLALVQQVLDTYQRYIRYLGRQATIDEREEFDRLHAELLSRAKMSRILFSDALAEGLTVLAKKLANVQNLRTAGKTDRADEQRQEAFQTAADAVEEMSTLLQ